MPRLRLFGPAGDAAGVTSTEAVGATVAEVLDWATTAFGPDFAEVLATSRVWLNGEPVPDTRPVTATDEVAVLPPVSGG